MKYTILLSLLTFTVTVQAQTSADSTFGYILPQFTDTDSNGVNDLYQSDSLENGALYGRDDTYNLEYKFRYGLGYGYGFADRDTNGTNDILDNNPDAANVNPTVARTRIGGMGLIKRGVIRHGKVDIDMTALGRIKDHVLHDGHNKNEDRYKQYHNPDGNQ